MSAKSTWLVYVSNANSGDISVIHMDRDSAALAEVRRVPVPKWSAATYSLPLAVHPKKHVLYANLRSTPCVISAFRIDPASGDLTPMGDTPSIEQCIYLTLDHTGRYLLGATNEPQVLFVCPVDAQGMMGPIQQRVPLLSKGHSVLVDPSNRFIFYPEYTMSAFARRSFDAATGRIGDDAEVVKLASIRARHFAFHPNRRFIYVLNEFDAMIDIFGYDPRTGAFPHRGAVNAAAPELAGIRPTASDIHLTPDGRLLYCADRASNTLAALRCNPDSGDLTLLGHFPAENYPRSFAITPDGRHLLCAGQKSHRMSACRIDQASGALRQVSSIATGENPNWIEVLDLAP